MLRAIQDSRQPCTPLEYVVADCDDPEDAVAIYALLESRAESAADAPVDW